MDFQALLQQFLNGGVAGQASTLQSLVLFAPELILSGSIVLMLLARLTSLDRVIPTHWIALFGSMAAFVTVLFQFWEISQPGAESVQIFTGLAMHDPFSIFFRGFLTFFLVFVIVLTVLTGIPDDEDAPDFYSLLSGAVIGMMLMSSANHLLMMFLGVEMASVPSYAMTGFLKGRRQSSEAALKFVIYGAGAAGVMLFGISLLAGLLGTAEFPEMASRFQAVFAGHSSYNDPTIRYMMLALLMITVGFAFKLSLVPFHFWCPDAFHGASAEVGGFLSIASKAAAFALLVRFSLSLTGDATGPSQDLALTFGLGLGFLASITATFGNLAAYSQQNIKRMLAYSTIAHAGYMLMAVSALLVLKSGAMGAESGQRAIQGLLYYLCVYLFMNLGAFAIAALIRNQTFSEEIEDYKGLAQQAPLLAVCMAICLFSLVGIPPLGGFYGKAFIFMALYDATQVHWFMWVVLIAGGVNTVLSLFYYLRVAKFMCISERPAGSTPVALPVASSSGVFVMLLSGMVVFLGIIINPLSKVALHAARAFF
ncbi:NADH-quinone oxidoreductase subunit N [Schlesneria paludicola]|uniref:NADH-quinone oxidoreductase subunit N n=1 Tax=Schlesneria paludicola TaxID=360056 RepID=UPI00029AC307|nr:NADH-quinone oxidoreductase subunit N [Schlesneria paludicola]